MIIARPFTDLSAMAVFRQLDPSDHLEAELIRGAPAHALGLFADWRAASRACLLNLCIETSTGTPFAVLALAHTGQAGVAEAALLARNHARFARPLRELAATIRAELPKWCAEHGIHRIEARCWAGHPSAARLLSLIGFRAEADMLGFGQTGQITFRQFAWIDPGLLQADHPPAFCAPDPACSDQTALQSRS